jgi:hypothetical protein
MQAARPQSSITPQFQQGGKVLVFTKDRFLRGQLNQKLKDRWLGPFLVFEKIGVKTYKLESPSAIRLHSLFHVKTLRPSHIATHRSFAHVTNHEDDEEYDVYRICD